MFFCFFGQRTLDKLVSMETKKGLSMICRTQNFANIHLGKVTEFQGNTLSRFAVVGHFLVAGRKTPPPPMLIALINTLTRSSSVSKMMKDDSAAKLPSILMLISASPLKVENQTVIIIYLEHVCLIDRQPQLWI